MKSILRTATGILFGLLLIGGVLLVACRQRGESIRLPPPPTPTSIQVNVVGAVLRPGVYSLDEGSRVADAVNAAGGFVPEADQNALNLAEHLENLQRLEIPYLAGSAPDVEQDLAVIAGNTPSLLGESDPVDDNSTSFEDLDEQPDIVPTITPYTTSADSCSNGPVGSGTFVWPADNHFLSGKDYGASHAGIDIAAGEGSPVYAADAGVITVMGNDEFGYGNVIQIDHGNGYLTVYAHLSKIGVKICQSVSSGQWIGAAGSTGNASGTHLHFEVIKDGFSINPWLVLP
jgi:murein DD-endopeptidase MepM/ murein hydrolase activator NlpD